MCCCLCECEYGETVRECEGDDSAGMWDEEGVIAVSEGHEYMGGAHNSSIVSSAYDVLEMSVVGGMRGVCECMKCVCVGLGAGW